MKDVDALRRSDIMQYRKQLVCKCVNIRNGHLKIHVKCSCLNKKLGFEP